MDRSEAIWYLQPIADSASLERYKEALNMAIAALREQEQREQEPKVVEIDQVKTEWISVEERLPEPTYCVLTYGAEGEMEIYALDFDGTWMGYVDVTHWMPLPMPPKEGEE